MLKIRPYIIIILLCFGTIAFQSIPSYAILDCKEEERSIQELTKQALIYKDQRSACQQENAKLQQEKDALSKELNQTRQELESTKEQLRNTQTNVHFSNIGIVFAAGLGLLAGVFLTVKTKNDARQRNS